MGQGRKIVSDKSPGWTNLLGRGHGKETMVKLFDKAISLQGPFSSCSGALYYITLYPSADGVN